ncbi:hypothetical protein SNOG_14576 [Parastagonospora nodorum SN15]|uniref:Translation machinery-associated protein 16 n=1 Tax=Phaeosphaeria nodorum (strain SN15 / ATCC MYA-4574 / FGSC 10173) TaxID=321614 RepID=Q0U160_PHANO|nr:hypothetical protein SNOG_14576 [Parastagonospora nodorum SN15]EAT78116.2 hypothetical protein SNOG_14576 [Parastagonospora nodorum SN15]
MVSNRLSKVTKQIRKKKGKNPNLHEGSRDTQRLQSAAARDDKLNRLTSLREKQNRHYCKAMIEDYLGRDDEEVLKLKAERRAGRASTASGFWVPDLENLENLKKLKEWNGQWAGLATLKFARISREGVKKESSFPPKGLS